MNKKERIIALIGTVLGAVLEGLRAWFTS